MDDDVDNVLRNVAALKYGIILSDSTVVQSSFNYAESVKRKTNTPRQKTYLAGVFLTTCIHWLFAMNFTVEPLETT